jgi:hypothetical protein
MEHTKGPLYYHHRMLTDHDFEKDSVSHDGTVFIATFYDHGEQTDVDAAHIVRCVNSHDALVEALKEMIDLHEDDFKYIDKGIGTCTATGETLIKARAALALAEDES